MTTRVTALKEVSKVLPSGEVLCLQQAIYDYGDGSSDIAFRFIRRQSNGNLKAQRGQAGIPTLDIARELINEMEKISLKQMR